MPQVIDGSKKNFNTTVVGDSVTVVVQYNVRNEFSTQFYTNSRAFLFSNRPVFAENHLTFFAPLVVTRLNTRPLVFNPIYNSLTVQRIFFQSETYGYSTATRLFITGSNSISIPVTSGGGGIGFVNAVPDPVYATANIYGVTTLTTGTHAFAIEQLSSTQTAGLVVGTIISATTNSNSVGSFGNGTVYVHSVVNNSSIIAVAITATVAPINGTIVGITPTGATYTAPPSPPPLVARFLIVGGGGGGGTDMGGGGGAGGYVTGTSTLVAGTYPITVGDGGAGAPQTVTNGSPSGSNGGNSTFNGLIAIGGGGGASNHNNTISNAGSGGSGGGGSGGRMTLSAYGGLPGAGTAGQGFAGAGSGITWYPGGGGGAGGPASQTGSQQADGGVGRENNILGTSLFWAGGGAGAGYTIFGGNGGLGGGGGGAPRQGAGTTNGTGGGSALNAGSNAVIGTTNAQTNVAGGSAGANTGGGGGGGSHYVGANQGGNGGSGIVVVRYPGSQRATGGTVTTVGSDTVHAFTTTGTSNLIVTGGALTIPTFRAPLVGPWTFTITGLSSTIDLPVNSVISAMGRTATFGLGNTVFVTNTGTSSITVSAFGGTGSPTVGFLNAVNATGEIVPATTINSVVAVSTNSYDFNIIGIRGTGNLSPFAVITATSLTGSFGVGNTVVIRSVIDNSQITAFASGPSIPIAGAITDLVPTGATGTIPARPGDAAFITTGTYSWIAPPGVTSVSVVAVGGGGGGGFTWSSGGGGGGGLGWRNNIAVTPGQSYTVVVGQGGESTANANNNLTNLGGTSFFISTATVAGYGGGRGGPGAILFGGGYGGGFFGDGGGRGGNGGYDGSWNHGGAGAGGYTGAGADSFGNSGTPNRANGTAAPDGGGGGAGGYFSSTFGVPAGGGVGIFGRGASGGIVGNPNFGGLGGSGGQQGVGGEGSGQSGLRTINGGRFGGGGGGSGTSFGGGWGGVGAVRIIWGAGRQFPVTNVAEIATIQAVVAPPPPTISYAVGGPSYNLKSRSINNLVEVLQQNHVPTIVQLEIGDRRRLTRERALIPKTNEYINVATPVRIDNRVSGRLFPVGAVVANNFPTTATEAISITTPVNITSNTTGTYIYRATPFQLTNSWIFRIYNISSSTVSSLTTNTIITANTSSSSTGNFGVGNTVTVTSITGPTSIIATAYGSLAPAIGSIDSISVPGGTYTPPPPIFTDINYTSPGTYTFTVPSNATTLSAMAVGGGGAGDDGNVGDGGGGGGSGGSAGFFNGLAVTPGQTLTIVVGAGGAATAVKNSKAPDGGLSSVTFGSFVMTAPGGIGGSPYSASPGAPAPSAPSFANTPGGVTTGGFAGGSGGAGWDGGGGGGGAGGLAGSGGAGSISNSGTVNQTAGFGGGGGGGGALVGRGTGGPDSGFSGASGGAGQSNVTGGGGGGSATYTSSFPATEGGAGNGLSGPGTRGGAGGFPGGGGGGSWDNNFGLASAGGGGFVRLVWAGTVRSYTGFFSGGVAPTPLENLYHGQHSAFVTLAIATTSTIRDYNVSTLTNVLSITSDTTPGLITSVTGSNPWTLTITQLRSTQQFTTGTVVQATSLGGSFGVGNTVVVAAVNSGTSVTCTARNGTQAPTTGTIVGVYAAGQDLGNYIGQVTGVATLTNTTAYSVGIDPVSTTGLQFAHTSTFNLVNLSWTAECWVRPNGDYLNYRTIFSKRVSGSGTASYQGYLRIGSGFISFFNGTAEFTSTHVLTPNVWSHCAWVYNNSAGTLNIYVNGVPVYNVVVALGADNTEPLVIGAIRGLSESFAGNISNFRIVRGLQVYTGNFTPSASPLTITQAAGTNISPISTGTFTVMLTCQSATFRDNSLYNNTATSFVGATVSLVSPFTTATSIAPFTFTISGITSTNAFIYGSIITATNIVGSLGTGTVSVQRVVNSREIICQSNAVVTAGRIGTVSTTGSVISFNPVAYEILTLTASANVTVTNNGTTNLNIFKTSSPFVWDGQAYTAAGYTAPVTMEFFKQAGIGFDNGLSYAMISWNSDPTTDANYTSLDHSLYAYRTDFIEIYHNGSLSYVMQTWNPADKFYLVYSTDGFVRHYNGSKLLYSAFRGIGQTVHLDSSLYNANSAFAGFSDVRIKRDEWLGADYARGGGGPMNYAPPVSSIEYSQFGTRSGPAASVSITKANAPETIILSQRFNSFPRDNGNTSMLVVTASNSPYAEGNNIGDQASEPLQIYTRDANTVYAKTRWVIPEVSGFLYGGGQAISVVVNGSSTPANYVKTETNAKLIAASNRITFATPISVGIDSGAIGTIGTVIGQTLGPWTFDITGLSSTVGFAIRDVISSQARVGEFGVGNTVYITLVNTSSYSLTCVAYGPTTPRSGIVNSIYPTGEIELEFPLITAISTLTTASWSFNIVGLKGTALYSTGSVVVISPIDEFRGSGGVGNTVIVSSIIGINQIVCYSTGTSTPRSGFISGVVPTSGTGPFAMGGDATFVTTGTYSWIAPFGITSVSVVAVGGGSGGGFTWASGGGGGGGLGWRNNIPVIPGQSYTVVVGSGGPSLATPTTAGSEGGTSFFISTATVAGFGGGRGGPGSAGFGGNRGGGFFGNGGGRGGDGNVPGNGNAGGAGGYSGPGADAGSASGVSAPAGSGAGAAGGYFSSTFGSPGGGGVGLFGRGADGGARGGQLGGGGGSGGANGVGGEGSGENVNRAINGGAFGGGGGGSGTTQGGGWGGQGAVRIIWSAGQSRSFPITNVGTFTSGIAVVNTSTRSANIGGSAFNLKSANVAIAGMQYIEDRPIDRVDQVITIETITNDPLNIKLFAFQNLSAANAGSRSITNSLTGSENFFIAGTGTDGATVLSAYWS